MSEFPVYSAPHNGGFLHAPWDPLRPSLAVSLAGEWNRGSGLHTRFVSRTRLSRTHPTSGRRPTTKAVLTAQFSYLGSGTRLPGCRSACVGHAVSSQQSQAFSRIQCKGETPRQCGPPKARGTHLPTPLGTPPRQARGSRMRPQNVRNTFTGPNPVSGHR